jgi:hypothetical protein
MILVVEFKSAIGNYEEDSSDSLKLKDNYLADFMKTY